MSKTLYFLIGPKGSGKTHIGTSVHENTDIHFLRVEPIWVGLNQDENGWQKVIEEIHQCFLLHNKVMIESLGAGADFNSFLATLSKQYQRRLIRVEADLDLCLKRVQQRNNDNHIPVSDAKVKEYNQVAAKVCLDWDLVIDNNGLHHMETILRKIISL